MKILLVDDDAFLRDMYATKFTESGHEVLVAVGGLDGLILIQDNDFDVVLLDMVMPGLSGLQFLAKIKELPKGVDLKCIVLSNQGESTDKEAAREAGAIGYIVKAESIPSEVVKNVESLVL